MRTLKAVFTMLFLVGVLPAWADSPSPEGKEFAPKNQMFTAKMPGSDKTTEATKILTIGKHKVPIESARSSSKDGPTFTAASMGIPAVVIREIPEEKRYEVVRDAIVKQLTGKVSDEKAIKQDSVPGKEYLIEGEKHVARMQLYIVRGWVMYAIVEGATKEKVTSKEADAFFEGFKMTDKAKSLVPK
ncbi:MAG TPA: hypothetical protein VKA46_06285 [Gemmataceae bacterium]|nr:hypothetical protein [Gemmataceae bacterium]